MSGICLHVSSVSQLRAAERDAVRVAALREARIEWQRSGRAQESMHTGIT
jgi:hypothetical protein